MAQVLGFLYSKKTHGLHGMLNALISPKLGKEYFRGLFYILGLVTFPSIAFALDLNQL